MGSFFGQGIKYENDGLNLIKCVDLWVPLFIRDIWAK